MPCSSAPSDPASTPGTCARAAPAAKPKTTARQTRACLMERSRGFIQAPPCARFAGAAVTNLHQSPIMKGLASPIDPLAGTLAADHPRIAALAASLESRARASRPVERERALLAELV